METPMFHNNLEKSDRILYTPSRFAKNNLIYLQETGELNAQRHSLSHRKNLNSCLFFIVLGGTGIVKYKNQEYMASKGDCIFLDCNEEYSHESLDDFWNLKWVHFYGDNLREIYSKYLEMGGKIRFKSKHFTEYDTLINEIYSLASSDENCRDMKIFEKLVKMLCTITDERFAEDISDSSAGSRNLTPIRNYINEYYNTKITLDDLAEKFYINKFYLTRLFKKQYGMSVVNYILQVRITHAKQLLRFTGMSIESISEECGFNDVNYFSRTFKKIEGVAPGQFRKMW